jgi:hypothetical protein
VIGAHFVEDMQQPTMLPSSKYIRATTSTLASGTIGATLTPDSYRPHSQIAGENHADDERDTEMADEDGAEDVVDFEALRERRRQNREKRARLKQEYDELMEEDNELRERQKKTLRATGQLWCEARNSGG